MTPALERRGYVKAGPWTPECTVEHPEAGLLFILAFYGQDLPGLKLKTRYLNHKHHHQKEVLRSLHSKGHPRQLHTRNTKVRTITYSIIINSLTGEYSH